MTRETPEETKALARGIDSTIVRTWINQAVEISALLDETYRVDLDPEARLWRRVTKVTEEVGEVWEALAGMLGENPRKGVTHTRRDVVDELLDVAAAALGAVAHLHGNDVDLAVELGAHITTRRDRLIQALDTPVGD